ncbi:MAG: DNA gyrase C-terminal beta-propeller domain-containing protein, partial [Campylobacter sp.]|nr:DNA gyrase C-terminal beta-propeller domain-containing protein [Campylobacter sp.]
DFAPNKSLAFFTKNGIVKRTNLSEYKNIRSIGVRAIKLDENDELVTALIVENEEGEIVPSIDGEENASLDISIENEDLGAQPSEVLGEQNSDEPSKMILIVTRKGMCVKFRLNKIRQMGRVSRGVKGISFKEKNDSVVGAAFIESNDQEILSVGELGIGKRTTADEYRLTNRGGKGVICMKLNDKTGDLIGVVMVDERMDLMALTTSGKMIRVDMQSIRKAGRNTSGVKVVNVDGEKVASIASCPKESEEENLDFDNPASEQDTQE